MHAPSTWHYGLIADYWALNNLDAPEIEIYEPHLTSPVLDAGCGSGRLFAPLHEHGFDIDGCDVSAGHARPLPPACARRDAVGLRRCTSSTRRGRYASIVCSGVFGLGSTREQDVAGLARLHDALIPGGVLVLDNEEREFRWRVRDWSEPSDGEIRLSSRVDAVDRTTAACT